MAAEAGREFRPVTGKTRSLSSDESWTLDIKICIYVDMKRLPLSDQVLRLRAAGEPTRARILAMLSGGELSVGELAQILGESQPSLSRHLKILTVAGLVDRMPEGAWVFYRLPDEGKARELVNLLNAAMDPADPVLLRDAERLAEAKSARASSASAYFARVADNWDTLRAMHYSDAEIEKAVLAAAGPGPFERVVDFGTGTGRMLALFAPIARRVEGIDLSHQMLTVARSNLERAGVRNASVRHGDATNAPYPDASVDLVVIHQVLHFLDEPGRALAEAARVLRPGGRLVVVDFAPHDLEELRTEHAHRRLGVSDQDLARWAEKAQLQIGQVRHFRPPPSARRGVTVAIWTADSRRARSSGRAA